MVREDEQQADRFLALLRPIERDLEVYCRRLVWNEHDFRKNIQAEQDLTRARKDYLKAVAEFNRAQYELSRAVGVSP